MFDCTPKIKLFGERIRFKCDSYTRKIRSFASEWSVSKDRWRKLMGTKTYDGLKWLALIFLPAAGAAYFGLGQIWHFPAIEEVVGSVTVVETFLGVILKKSASNYGSATTIGDAIVTQYADGQVEGLRFEVDASTTPVVMQDKKIAMFKVRREQLTQPAPDDV